MIVIIGIGTLAFCIFALPAIWKEGSAEFPMASYAVILIVIVMYATAIPFFIGLWHTLKLLNYIDHDKAFSDLSVKALQNITWCATIIAILYICGVPLLFPIAQADDAPGLIIVGTVIACIPTAVAVFTSILQKLLKEAIKIKLVN